MALRAYLRGPRNPQFHTSATHHPLDAQAGPYCQRRCVHAAPTLCSCLRFGASIFCRCASPAREQDAPRGPTWSSQVIFHRGAHTACSSLFADAQGYPRWRQARTPTTSSPLMSPDLPPVHPILFSSHYPLPRPHPASLRGISTQTSKTEMEPTSLEE